jgi:hypothetical protein
VRVIARASNPDGRFRPGMSADVSVILAQRAKALTVPGEAVFAQGSQFLVYRVQDDGTVASVPVQLGARTAAAVEIVEGLAEGEMVVRAGHQKLFPGAKVMSINAQGPAAAAGGEEAAAAGGEEAAAAAGGAAMAGGEEAAGGDETAAAGPAAGDSGEESR